MITKPHSRREAFQFLIGGAIAAFSLGYPHQGFAFEDSNFRRIYLNPALRDSFFQFLANVFHLYPEHAFHDLILKHTQGLLTDREIYQAILADIPSIRPALQEIRFALPSLKKQKQVMAEQTVALLGSKTSFNGYLEVGSTGRYHDRLADLVELRGNKYFVHTQKPTFGAADIVERGQLTRVGTFQPLNDYQPLISPLIAPESLDLLTVYIGFHHAPPEHRAAFIQSCFDCLRKGGVLIVRDHDVTNEDMGSFVALAHDVFNVGLELPWETDAAEIRNFTSLQTLDQLLKDAGFTVGDKRLIQAGDPTHNTLISYAKR